MSATDYLGGYPEGLREQARALISSGQVENYFAKKYPELPSIRNDRDLYQLVTELKTRYLKRSAPLSKICFCDKITSLHSALGLHSFVSRVQGAKLKAKNEIRIAAVLKQVPHQLLLSVVVHELAHLKEMDHNKAFYQLCCHMDPAYHQHEFDLRIFLSWKGL